MSLDALIEIAPPPTVPIHVPSAEQWRALEADVGTPLPPDYKAFLARYGSGGFGSNEANGFFDLVFVLSPGQSVDKHGLNAIPLMRELTGSLDKVRHRWPDQVQAPVWPEPGGLLYVGGTTTQNDFYWKTAGAPEAWTCMVTDYGYDNWFHWEGDLTSLLAAIATAQVPKWIIEGPTHFPLVFRDLVTLAGIPIV